MSGFFGIMHQSIRGRQIVDIGRSLLQKDDRCKKQLSCHTTHSSWGQRTVADLSRTSAFAYLLVHVSWQWKESKRNQSPHQNLTPSHQIFHVATLVRLAWGTERGADRTLVGAWIPPFINLYRFQSTSSGVFGLLELCVQDTVNIYDNEALSFEPQISIFRNTEFILRMQWTFNPLCSSVDFIHSRPAQRSVPRPHCSTRSVECRCHLDPMEISNHGVSIEIPGPFVLYDVFSSYQKEA